MALDIGTEEALEEVLETVDKALHKHYWLNTTEVMHPVLEHPCVKLDYCPYGAVVELYPLLENRGNKSCQVFGHDCPVHYLAEIQVKEV